MAEKMTEAFANQMMDQGFHCSQVVLMHAAEVLGRDKDEAMRISAGLGGGLFHGEACGAVSAAAVALSMVYGFAEPNPGEIDELLKAKVHEFEDRFIEQFGSLRCVELLQEGEDKWARCGEYCEYACTLLDDLLG